MPRKARGFDRDIFEFRSNEEYACLNLGTAVVNSDVFVALLVYLSSQHHEREIVYPIAVIGKNKVFSYSVYLRLSEVPRLDPKGSVLGTLHLSPHSFAHYWSKGIILPSQPEKNVMQPSGTERGPNCNDS